MLASVTPHPKALLPFLLTMAYLAASLPTPPLAQAGVMPTMLNCNTMCSGGTCTVTAACPAMYPNACPSVESIRGANMAVCTLGAVDGMAMAMATMGTPATCSVFFANECGTTANCTMGYAYGSTTCVVDSTDGLPVELLDFKVSAGPKPPPSSVKN